VAKSNSKKRGKGTSHSAVYHFLTSRGVWFLSQPPRKIYPGSIIDVSDISEFFCIDADGVQTVKPLPPGVPLDEDIFDGILWHLHKLHIHPNNELVVSMALNAIDTLQMEALWRRINKDKKHQ
jgi:hypothetical protein